MGVKDFFRSLSESFRTFYGGLLRRVMNEQFPIEAVFQYVKPLLRRFGAVVDMSMARHTLKRGYQ